MKKTTRPYIILGLFCVALIVALLNQTKDPSQTSKSVVSVQKQDQVASSKEANTVEVHVHSKIVD